MNQKVCLTWVLMFALTGFASAGNADVVSLESLGQTQPTREVIYKTIGDVQLKLYIFEPQEHEASDRAPAVVFFFGGGWVGGTPKQFFPHCAYLAQRGMVAMSAQYRVKNRNGTTPYECVKDGKSAIRWVRTHAAELGIDSNRIAAGGGSAGGQVAAATGTTIGFEEAGEDTSISSRPNAMALFNPVYDNGPDGWGYAQVKDHWQAFSPANNIRPGTPPAIVFLGSNDKLIPVATAEKFRDNMIAAACRSELHVYEGQGHGFFNFGRGGNKSFIATVRAMDAFLASLGYLEGEATLETEAGG